MDWKKNELAVLLELVKGSRRSDREISKVIGVSQPTVTRTRAKLEEEGWIREYAVIPDLIRLGYELMVFTFMSFSEDKPELFDRARQWVKKRPCIIFAKNGEGLGTNSLMISLHTDYASYSRLLTELRRDWQPNLVSEQGFVVSLERADLTVKPFGLANMLTQCKE